MYKYCNQNPLNRYTDDCVIRAISCATNRSWDSVYDELSELAQYNGTLFDQRDFVRWYLDDHFRRVPNPPSKVYQVAQNYAKNVVLCTIKGHICCIKYGIIYDTFNPSDRNVEDIWIVK